MATLGPMSHAMRRAAISQDKIGWREFTEGKYQRILHGYSEFTALVHHAG